MRETKNGTKVFIAGSRSLSRLGKDVKERIDSIVDKGLAVVVGDANGIDKAVQRYLDDRGYKNVTVFCMQGGCRNNVGGWPVQKIAAADSSRRDFAYYATKDRAMVEQADYGLMIWDGRSRGTLRSIVDLVRRSKPVVAYVAPASSFYTLRQSDDIADMLSHVDPAALQGIDAELRSFAMSGGSGHKSESLPLF
jgi:hypothetical protein